MSIRHKAIEQAINILKACNAQYKIICADGTEYGALEAKPRPCSVKVNNFKRTGYIEKVHSMKVGDIIEMQAPDDLPLEGLRSCVSSTASTHFGQGAVITTVNKETRVVEAMRGQ